MTTTVRRRTTAGGLLVGLLASGAVALSAPPAAAAGACSVDCIGTVAVAVGPEQAHLELGRPDRARALAATGRDAAVAQGVPFEAAWLAWAVAHVDLVTGYAEDARAGFRELATTSAHHGLPQVQRLAAQGLTECHALLGDAAGAHDWLRRAQALPAAVPAYDPATTMARAWALLVDGDTAAATVLLRDHGRALAAGGELREAAVLLDEAVLFGDRDAAHDLLAVVDRVDTPVGRARALRARAVLSGSPQDLLAAAETFAACDFVHSAATLATRAAGRLRAAGDPRAAAAADERAAAWAARSPGLRVDGLAASAGSSRLTPREREIATMAAAGRSSREVAEGLVLSVRTVDNHLASVYAKLGIRGRAQLAGALGLEPGPATSATPGVPAARSGDRVGSTR